MTRALEERRLKIVRFDQQQLVDIFNWWRNPPHWLALPITDELPEDCVVVDVRNNFEYRCIEAVVASDSFEPTQPGFMLQVIPGMITFRSVEIGKTDSPKVQPVA